MSRAGQKSLGLTRKKSESVPKHFTKVQVLVTDVNDVA